jgi:hypothetical protein
MKRNHRRDGVRSAGSRKVSVRFEIAPSTAIPIHVASTCNDWRRVDSFVPSLFDERRLNLPGSGPPGPRNPQPHEQTSLSTEC